MDTVLSFFSDLILFTAGLLVITFWIVIFAAIGIEIHDAIKERPSEEEDRF